MRWLIEYVGCIDWGIFVQRVLWSLPLAVLVVLACWVVFCLADRTGQKKIDYVYASEEQKEDMRGRACTVRKRVLVCVFWIMLLAGYVLQYLVDGMVLGGI